MQSANSSQGNMLILQESCTDPTASFVIYAPVDIVAMNVVLNGGDPDYVALLPSGFAIFPDGTDGGRIADVTCRCVWWISSNCCISDIRRLCADIETFSRIGCNSEQFDCMHR
ncbi:hypothetical protein GQ457_10G002490 [Hibiscus cannabinus]